MASRNSPSVERARIFGDRGLEFYREGETLFAEQFRLLDPAQNALAKLIQRDAVQRFHPRAGDIYKQMKATQVSESTSAFFDGWVHDSYAGFIGKFREPGANWSKMFGQIPHRIAEAQRYVRWRGVFAGSDTQLNDGSPSNGDQKSPRRAA